MAKIGVQILGDSTSLERAFKRSEVAAAEFNGRMNALSQTTRGAFTGSGFNKGAFLFGSSEFIGGAIAAAAITKSVQAASDLNEQIQKTQVVFGDASKEVLAFGDTSARSLGISKREAISSAGTFGNLFRTVGLLPKENAKLSTSLVKLAADLASFNNTNPEDALLAIRSALVGEVEPLRRYGARVNEARVQQVALADSGKKSVKALTEQEKVLARIKIIFKDTAAAQGDVDRTSQSFANQTRQLRAQLDDLEATLGAAVLPTINEFTQDLNDALFAVQKLIGGLKDLKALAPIDIPVSVKIALEISTGHNVRKGVSDLGKLIGDGVRNAVDAATSKGTQTFQGLENLFSGKGGTQFRFFPSPTDTSGLDKTADKAGKDGKRLADSAAETEKALKRFEKAFDTHIKGLQLKLDKAQLTDTLSDDIAVLQETERSILAAEKKLGKTFKLESQLTAVRGQIKSLRDQQEAAAVEAETKALQKHRDAIQNVLDNFDLKLSKASLTATLNDDLKVLNAELAAVNKLLAADKSNTDLKQKQLELEGQILDLKKQQTAETKAQFDAAKSRAESLFGTLFKAQAEAQRTITILGGSKGKQTVVLPGAGGGEDARGLLGDLTTQIKSFRQLQANILELQRKGAPKSLIEAARSGEISADQINALASANSKTLNAIFRNVRLADKLVSKAARAEIQAKDVNLRANTVTIRGAVAATAQEHGRGDSGDIVIHTHTYVDGKKIDNSIERHRKKRTQQTRGRAGGKR